MLSVLHLLNAKKFDGKEEIRTSLSKIFCIIEEHEEYFSQLEFEQIEKNLQNIVSLLEEI